MVAPSSVHGSTPNRAMSRAMEPSPPQGPRQSTARLQVHGASDGDADLGGTSMTCVVSSSHHTMYSRWLPRRWPLHPVNGSSASMNKAPAIFDQSICCPHRSLLELPAQQ